MPRLLDPLPTFAALALGLAAACPVVLPPSDRTAYRCSVDDDCSGGLRCADEKCQPATITDAASPVDRGTADHPPLDRDPGDLGAAETSISDTQAIDGSHSDVSLTDGAPSDATGNDVVSLDRRWPDLSAPDTRVPDAWQPDTSAPDTWAPDRWMPDTYQPDAGPAWWDRNYLHRRQLTVLNNSAALLPADYSVALVVDHSALVGSGSSRSDGSDLRIVEITTGNPVEIDRVAETAWNSSTTAVWFRTRGDIPASSSDGRYYAYYGNPSAGAAPADRRNVYLFWDDFDDGSIGDWTVISGSWSAATDQKVSGSHALMTTTGSESWIKPTAPLDFGDVELEAFTRVAGGGPDWAFAARVQPGSARNWYEVNAEPADWALARQVNGSWTRTASATPRPAAGTWYKVALRLTGSQGKALVDGSQRVPASGYSNLGSNFASGTIAFRTWDIGGGAWFDDVKLRRFRDPEPTVAAGPEE